MQFLIAVICISSTSIFASNLGLKSLQSHNFSNSFIRHINGSGMITTVSTELDQADATFNIVPGLADNVAVSFEASNYPGCYLRHSGGQIVLNCFEDSQLYKDDATFYANQGLADTSKISFESKNYPGQYIRHSAGYLFIAPNDGSNSFAQDSTFTIRAPLTEGDIDGLNFYFGNLHSHTEYSDGKGTPAEGYLWARDNAGYDFYAVTDHDLQISGREWDRTLEHANAYENPGYFATLRGFEWSHPYYGHVNVFNTSSITNWISKIRLTWFYEWLDDKNALAQFNHPGREDEVFHDLKFKSHVADNFYGIETGNKGTGNNDGEFLSYYQMALDKGWRVAPTNNQDNHSLSTNTHRSVMIMPYLSRQDMLDTMRARRIYSSDDPNMKVVFKLNDAWMGDIVPATGTPLEFNVQVFDDEPIQRIELVSNYGEIISSVDYTEDNVQPTWNPVVMLDSNTYYYVKVYETNWFDEDGGHNTQITVTAPIWIQ